MNERSDAEYARASFDKTTRDEKISVVNGALGAAQGKRALLQPNAAHTITVSYDVATTGVDANGKPAAGAQPLPAMTQDFAFRTDGKPPTRLESWTLATDPADGESGFFFGDPVRIVFATNATRKLFARYGQGLRANVRAASGKHPPAAAGFDPALVKLNNALVQPKAIPAVAVTPFEGALLSTRTDAPCITSEGAADRHELGTLTLLLDPLTNYLVDLEAYALDDAAAPTVSDQTRPPLRRAFTTSRYKDVQSFAADIGRAAVRHRSLSTRPVQSAPRFSGPSGSTGNSRA